jgi:hypothetical protein
MARFYATFNHETVPSLEAKTSGNYYDPRFIGPVSGSGSVLQQGLLASQSALSSTVYAALEDVNKNGALGTVIPADVITLASTTLAWTNVYTTGSAVWQSDPKNRPNTRNILVSNGDPNLIAASPSDPGNVLRGTYDSASLALSNVLADIRDTGSLTPGNGPYGRLGTNPSRTLFSIWSAHDLNHIGWDDFTPGQVQVFTASPRANNSGVFQLDFDAGSVANGLMVELSGGSIIDDLIIRFDWKNQFLADLAGDSILDASATPAGGTANTLSGFNPGQGIIQYDWNLGTGAQLSTPVAPGRQITLNSAEVKFKDATIPAHTGISATISSGVVATVLQVQQKSLKFVASGGGVGNQYFCTNNVAAGTYYSNAITTSPDTNGLNVGGYRVFTSKTSGASLGAGYYIRGTVSTPAGPGGTYEYWSSTGGDIDGTGNVTCP